MLRETLDELAVEVEKELGEEWTRSPKGTLYSVPSIQHKDGYSITLRGEKNRIKITAHLPPKLWDHKPYDFSTRYESTITVASERGAAKIAKEIQNRLLPKWLPLMAECGDRLKAFEDRTAKVAKNTDALFAIVEEIGEKSISNDKETGHIKLRGYRNTVDVRFDEAELTLRVSIELAAKILRLLHSDAQLSPNGGSSIELAAKIRRLFHSEHENQPAIDKSSME